MLAQAVSNAGLHVTGDLATSLAGIRQLAASIKESVLSIRAQPLKPVFRRMQRIAREACDATGKQARLVMIGDTTEMEKTVVERLADRVPHMIRNSVDHGTEPPAQRAAMGKLVTGVITLSAAHRSGRIIIELTDDGGGIDRARVRAIADTKGLVATDAVLTRTEIDNLPFLPGFSSKQEASAISGRGVGLDVPPPVKPCRMGAVMMQHDKRLRLGADPALGLIDAEFAAMAQRIHRDTRHRDRDGDAQYADLAACPPPARFGAARFCGLYAAAGGPDHGVRAVWPRVQPDMTHAPGLPAIRHPAVMRRSRPPPRR